MTLDAISAGVQVLVDANILIYARRGMSFQSRRLLERCARQEITGVLTNVAIAEFCHRRMMQEAQSRGLAGANPSRALSQDRALVRQLSGYAREVEDLLAGQFVLLAIEGADFAHALKLQHDHGLLTNDSLHLAAGLRAHVNVVATADPQFDQIPGIQIAKPDDLRQPA